MVITVWYYIKKLVYKGSRAWCRRQMLSLSVLKIPLDKEINAHRNPYETRRADPRCNGIVVGWIGYLVFTGFVCKVWWGGEAMWITKPRRRSARWIARLLWCCCSVLFLFVCLFVAFCLFVYFLSGIDSCRGYLEKKRMKLEFHVVKRWKKPENVTVGCAYRDWKGGMFSNSPNGDWLRPCETILFLDWPL